MVVRRSLVAALAASLVALAASACSSGDPARPMPQEPEEITFSQTIQPILQDRCQSCHREGGVAPFPLVSYQDAVTNGVLARQKVLAREMPPWGAFDDDACKMQHKIKDDLRLTDDEIAKIASWVENGMPMGDASKAPAARTYAAEGLLDKTHTFKMAQPHDVLAAGMDDLRCFPIDPGFAEDTWIGGSNVVPGDPRVVHHVLVYVDPNGESPALAAKAAQPDGSYPCFGGPQVSNPNLLLAWAPGVRPASYGADAGIKVTKGSKLVLQIHYHPHTQASTTDQTGFELKVLPYKPSFVTQILLAGNAETNDPTALIHRVPAPKPGEALTHFLIPKNAPDHVEVMEVTIPEKFGNYTFPTTSIMAAGSHMHWAGVDLKIEIARKNPSDGQPEHECILGTPKYNFNWQRAYVFDEDFEKLPTVAAGDTVRFTCTYNNTTSNKYVAQSLAEDHSEVHDIKLGETTRDEMCLGALVAVRRASAADF